MVSSESSLITIFCSLIFSLYLSTSCTIFRIFSPQRGHQRRLLGVEAPTTCPGETASVWLQDWRSPTKPLRTLKTQTSPDVEAVNAGVAASACASVAAGAHDRRLLRTLQAQMRIMGETTIGIKRVLVPQRRESRRQYRNTAHLL